MSLKASIGLCMIVCTVVGMLAYNVGYSRAEEQQATRLYELRTYTTHPGRLEALNARFKNHTIKLFEKHGIKNGLYWIPTDEKLKDNTLIYFRVSSKDPGTGITVYSAPQTFTTLTCLLYTSPSPRD